MYTLSPKIDFYNLLVERIPAYPLSADYPILGLGRRKKEDSLSRDIIQLNASNEVGCLVLDVDSNIDEFDWERGVPLPNFLSVNPTSHHAHVAYVLGQSIPLPCATPRQLKMLELTTEGLTQLWDADRGYNHLVCKNPLSPRWITRVFRERPYTLYELAEFTQHQQDTNEVDAEALREDFALLGRNCKLFEELRLWSYAQIRDYYRNPVAFHSAVLQKALDLNDGGLGYNEVKSTAKSIANWTYEHMTERRSKEKRMAWSKRATARSISKRKAKREAKLEAFAKVFDPSTMYPVDVAEMLGISERTAERYARTLREREAELQAIQESETPLIPGLL